MSFLTVTGTDNETRSVDATPGMSVMEIIRDAGYDDLLALCGGSCSCATCHVIVHPDDFARLAPAAEGENDMLDSSEHRVPTSRLSCQIPFKPELDGLRVTVVGEG